MYIFDLKVGYSCNNDCVHCIIAMNRDKLIAKHEGYDRTTDECKLQIDNAVESWLESGQKVSKVVITGGEPSTREDLVELCNYIQSKGFGSIDIQSNGRGFADLKLVQKLTSSFSVKFIIALHGPTAEVHDAVTRKPGSFEETVQGMQNIKDCNGFTVGKIVLSKTNYASLMGIMELYNKLGVKHVNVAFPHSNEGDISFDSYVPSYTEIMEEIKNCTKYSHENGIYVTYESIPFCLLEGHENLVCELRTRNYKYYSSPVKSSIYDLSEKRPQAKAKTERCKECLFDNLCEGTWREYIHSYGGGEFTPITNIKQFLNALGRIEDSNSKPAVNSR